MRFDFITRAAEVRLISMKTILRWLLRFALFVFILGWLVPAEYVLPVEGMNKNSYHKDSFWYYPWGKSITHKGVDIFAREGTDVNAMGKGWVLYSGKWGRGGDVVLILGARWRMQYYAHLSQRNVKTGELVGLSDKIGEVGDSGNAKGKPPHLHFSLLTLFPYPWQWDSDHQGWMKMFYLDPTKRFDFK